MSPVHAQLSVFGTLPADPTKQRKTEERERERKKEERVREKEKSAFE